MLKTLLRRLKLAAGRTAPPPCNRHVKPELEHLEHRLVPAVKLKQPPPQLDFQIVYGFRNEVSITGKVENLQGVPALVTFRGPVNQQVLTDPNGAFRLDAPATFAGEIKIKAVTLSGKSSAVLGHQIASTPPRILDFRAIHEHNNIWTFEGRVEDEHARGLIVTFGGIRSLQGQTAEVTYTGRFYLTLRLNPGEEGTAWARTTDWFKLNSDTRLSIVRQ